jgi:hypothetical protein
VPLPGLGGNLFVLIVGPGLDALHVRLVQHAVQVFVERVQEERDELCMAGYYVPVKMPTHFVASQLHK